MRRISFILVFLLFVSLTINVDAKKMKSFGCQTKNYTKTCKYGYPQSDVGKVITTKYRKNWTLKEKKTEYYSPLVWKRIVYKYNSKGQLKSNKYGKASRYTQNYYSNITGKSYSKLLIKNTELKVYNSKGKVKSRYVENYSAVRKEQKKSSGNEFYYISYLSQKKYYKYNSMGQLKSNKYGKAYRTIIKYKENGNRISKTTDKYNSKGKLV